MLKLMIELMERGLLPDWLVRMGIRNLCSDRLKTLRKSFGDHIVEARQAYALDLAQGSLAQATREANQQHYEVPTEFFLSVLGKSRKYSCAFFETSSSTLDEAETTALDITIARAEISDGMKILELGCGWGSLTLHMARRFPNSQILAISNSQTQRAFIENIALTEGLKNVSVKTLDLSSNESVNAISSGYFDRVVSVEMFEHFKNYKILLSRVSQWLKVDGKLFVHIFTHQKYSYPFDTEGEDNWMGRYFFTGGQMPSRDLFTEFQEHLRLEKQWNWSGTHYQKTAEQWLKNLDKKRDYILKLFEKTYGPSEAKRWLERWRVFFISCAELFGFDGGAEWGVTHYLFSQKQL